MKKLLLLALLVVVGCDEDDTLFSPSNYYNYACVPTNNPSGCEDVTIGICDEDNYGYWNIYCSQYIADNYCYDETACNHNPDTYYVRSANGGTPLPVKIGCIYADENGVCEDN